jgi:PPM family protein phosphatase
VRDGRQLEKISVDDLVPGARRGVLSQSLGGTPSYVPVDAHLSMQDGNPGNGYIICSDGLTDMVPLDGMEACLSGDIGATVSKLLEAALAAGGADNITVLYVRTA